MLEDLKHAASPKPYFHLNVHSHVSSKFSPQQGFQISHVIGDALVRIQVLMSSTQGETLLPWSVKQLSETEVN